MKKYFFTILLSFSSILVIGQLSLQATLPTSGLIQKSQLWNVLVINTSASSYQCKLSLLLKDRYTGQDVLTASSGEFMIEKGAKQLNINALSPIQYNYVSSATDTRLEGLIPVGSYTACYTLSLVSGKGDLATDCFEFDAEPLTPTMLTFPVDSSKLDNNPTQFVWTPPTPTGMFNRLHYQILVTEIHEGQKAEEAIQQNLPFYSEGNVFTNLLNYPPSSPAFEKDKWYAWQVVARDDNNYSGKSETWVFSIPNSKIAETIVEQAPFLKMGKGREEKGIAPNGILKLSYLNETADSTGRIKIINLSDHAEAGRLITISLKPGENLIEYDLNKIMKVQEGKIYEALIINSRKEGWSVQFEIRSYKGKKTTQN